MQIKFALQHRHLRAGLRLGGGGGGGPWLQYLSLVSEAATPPLLSPPARLSLLNIFNPSFVSTFTSHCDHPGSLAITPTD